MSIPLKLSRYNSRAPYNLLAFCELHMDNIINEACLNIQQDAKCTNGLFLQHGRILPIIVQPFVTRNILQGLADIHSQKMDRKWVPVICQATGWVLLPSTTNKPEMPITPLYGKAFESMP
jgi:hypothetical protein